MLTAYRQAEGHLEPLPADRPLKEALWIDLYRPEMAETIRVAGLGIDVPTLEDMEEIEVSNRLYRERRAEVMTVVLPGVVGVPAPVSMPVSFILAPGRLVTVRHHKPRSFETFPFRADRTDAGCDTPEAVLLGLVEEIVGRLADILEGTGREIDEAMRGIYRPGPRGHGQDDLQKALEAIGHAGDVVGKVRLSLLSMQRAVLYFVNGLPTRSWSAEPRGTAARGTEPVAVDAKAISLKTVAEARERDIAALEVHADFLSTRVGLVSDAALGMINLAQSNTMRIVSVLTVLFMPPTLIASLYGMNFTHMPELDAPWGYPAAIGLMIGSAFAAWALFRWKRWL